MNEPRHPEIAEKLLAYADGELPPPEAAAIAEHLADCEDCRRELEELRRTAAFLDQALRPARLSAEERRRLAARPAAPRRPIPRWVRAAAVLLAVTAAAWVYVERRTGDTQYATVVRSTSLVAGGPGSVTLRLSDQQSGEPLAGGRVAVRLVSSAGKAFELGRDTSDAEGHARINFDLPDLPPGEYRMELSAVSAQGRDELVRPVRVERKAQLLLAADKPLYQPGQTIELKALARRVPGFQPDAGRRLVFTLVDPRGHKLFKQERAASRFGIAALSIPLGQELRPGRYRIQVAPADRPAEPVERVVTVRRYVVPPFRVDVRPAGERSWAMPGQPLRLHVSAQYHFGKPVAGGTVALAFTDPLRSWPGALPAGVQLDAQGRATIELSVPRRVAALGALQMVRLPLQVSVTDRARHTEQRVHELALARQPVLIDVLPGGGYRTAAGVEQELLISTIRPDGTPVACTVQVGGRTANSGPRGLARLRADTSSSHPIVARTASGEIARWNYRADLWQQSPLLLVTDRALYRTGEKVELELHARSQTSTVFVDLVKDGQTYYTGATRLERGSARLTLPLSPELAGIVTLSAYRLDASGVTQRTSRQVFVARAQELKIGARLVEAETGKPPAGAVFRPGSRVTYEFTLADGKGQPVTGALSAAIVDRAVLGLAESAPGMAAPAAELERELLRPRAHQIHRPLRPRAVLPAGDAPSVEQQAAADFLLSRTASRAPRQSVDHTDWGAKLRQVEAVRRQARRLLAPLALSLPLILCGWALVVFPLVRKVAVVSCFLAVFGTGMLMIARETNLFFTGSSSLREGVAQDVEYGTASPMAMTARSVTLGREPGQSAVPRIRSRFVETLLWAPEIITDEHGRATKSFELADNLTGWRTLVEAVDGAGRTGAVETGFTTFQPFIVRPDLPLFLTQHDEVAIPVALHNYTKTPQSIALELAGGDWFELIGQRKQQVELAPGEVTARHFTIRAKRFGLHTLTVTGRGATFADGVRRSVRVLPDGERLEGSVSSRLSGGTRTLMLPPDAIDGTRRLWLRVYPGAAAEALDGLAALIRMPHG